jgi:hypothetical protein
MISRISCPGTSGQTWSSSRKVEAPIAQKKLNLRSSVNAYQSASRRRSEQLPYSWWTSNYIPRSSAESKL